MEEAENVQQLEAGWRQAVEESRWNIYSGASAAEGAPHSEIGQMRILLREIEEIRVTISCSNEGKGALSTV